MISQRIQLGAMKTSTAAKFGLLGLVILLILDAVISIQNVRRLDENNSTILEVHEILAILSNIILLVKHAETEQRGYIITGLAAPLKSYEKAVSDIGNELDRLKFVTADDPMQQQHIDTLKQLIAKKSEFMDKTISVRHKRGLGAARERLLSGQNQRTMSAIEREVSAMRNIAGSILKARNENAGRSYGLALISGPLGALVGIFLVGVTAYLFQRYGRVREQAAFEIRQQKEWLETVLASIGDAVIATDAKGRIIFINNEAQRLTGWQDAGGRSLDEIFLIVNETTRIPLPSPIAFVIRDGTLAGHGNDTLLIARNGTECPIDYSAAPIRSAQGEIQGVIIVFRNITAYKRAHASLKRSEAQLSGIISSAMDAIITIDEKQHVVLFNAAAEQLFGCSAGEAVGQPLEQFIPERFRSVHRRHVNAFGQGSETKRRMGELGMVYGRRINGEEFPLEASISQTEIGAKHYTVILRDVTERKQNETRLLEQANQLRELDQRKDEFLAMLAHELRNPLAPLRNAAQILKLQAHELPPAIVKIQAIVERQVDQLVRLVDDLLDMARITQGKIALQQETLDLRTVIEQTVEISQPLIREYKHQLELSLPEEGVNVRGDPTRLTQVIANILNNAAKYTPKGGNIALQLTRTNDAAVISVRDNGSGIPQEIMPHIFDLFTQANRTLHRSQGGLGIGLTLVRQIIEMHGGTVQALSAGPGQGSEFIVRLPIFSAENCDDIQQKHTPIKANIGTNRQRILVVDDNLDSAESISALVALLGHEVKCVYDGEAALEIARSFRPDVILLDVGLPGKDGLEVARILRKDPAFADTRVIAVTGYGQEKDRRETRAAGFDDHFVKPVSLPALQNLLKSA